MDVKKNIPLIVGLAIPLLMIIFVAVSIYLPALFANPQFDFLYSTGNYPMYFEQQGGQFTEHTYYVKNKKLVEETRLTEDRHPGRYRLEKPTFYLYDVETDTNQELTFEQAQSLTLDTGKKSPDGFEVTCGRSDGGVFPFVFGSGRNCDKRYLKGDNTSKEINVNTGSGSYYSYYRNFNFIGWVIE